MNYNLFNEINLLSEKKFSILKWAGGKKKLIPQIMNLISKCYKNSTYYEPFLGSGAIAFSCTFEKMVLGDKNEKLMGFYESIKNNPQMLIDLINSMCDDFNFVNNKLSFFNDMKNEFNSKNDDNLKKSALFWFLNRAGFNGMYRENKNGEYNIPFAQITKIKKPDPSDFLYVSSILNSKDCTIKTGCYTETCKEIKPGDILYLDPPYIPLTITASFSSYTKEDFEINDHLNLKMFIEKNSSNGVNIILSNSNSPKTIEIYGNMNNFKIEEVEVTRLISGQSKGRGKIKELIIHNISNE